MWFYRDAIDAMLSVRDSVGALRYVEALEQYTRAEPLPWAQLFAARGRVLAAALDDSVGDALLPELQGVRAALVVAGFDGARRAVDAALAVVRTSGKLDR